MIFSITSQMTTHRDIIYDLIKYPISADPNYNKSMYHIYMSAKLMAFAELMIFTYDNHQFINYLNDLFRFLLQYPTIMEEFPTFTPIIITAIKYIRTNTIMFSEQTDAFQLTRQLMDANPQLIYTIK